MPGQVNLHTVEDVDICERCYVVLLRYILAYDNNFVLTEHKPAEH